jgi:hypothetical protein
VLTAAPAPVGCLDPEWLSWGGAQRIPPAFLCQHRSEDRYRRGRLKPGAQPGTSAFLRIHRAPDPRHHTRECPTTMAEADVRSQPMRLARFLLGAEQPPYRRYREFRKASPVFPHCTQQDREARRSLPCNRQVSRSPEATSLGLTAKPVLTGDFGASPQTHLQAP